MPLAQLITLPGIKTQFAVGLSWRHADHKPSSRELREIAIQEGRWGMLRTTALGHHQVGTCDGVDGTKSPKGVRALAALLADHHREPWMGLYPLSDGNDGLYWYIAVRDGGEIFPGGDRVGTIDELMLVRNEHQRVGPWNEYNGTFNELLGMVEEMPMQPGLRDLTARPWLMVGYIGALTVMLVTIAAAWLHHQEEQERHARELAEARERAIKAAHKAKADAEARVLPWTREPQAGVLLTECHQVWANQPLVDNGWELNDWHCRVTTSGAVITTNWLGNGASPATAPGHLGPLGKDSTDVQGVAIRYPTPSPLALADEAARRAVWDFAQLYAMTLKLVDDSAQAQPGASTDLNAGQVWETRTADFSMDIPPWNEGLLDNFESLPGLRVKSVDWTAQTGKWSVHAILYSLRSDADKPVNTHTRKPTVHHQNNAHASSALAKDPVEQLGGPRQTSSIVSGVFQ